MKTAQDYVVMALVAAVCVLGTVVFLRQQDPASSCNCDHSATSAAISQVQSDVAILKSRLDRQWGGGSIGSPIGKPVPVGSPAP